MTRRSSRPNGTLTALSVVVAASLACAARAPQVPAHRPIADPGLTAELDRLDEALDRVEERLLASQARVSLWDELRERHESVSAVTCANLNAHANAIAAATVREREKELEKARGRPRNRLASRVVAPPTAVR